LTRLAGAVNLGRTFLAEEAAVLKKAALDLAFLRAWAPRLEKRTADRVTRVMTASVLGSGEEEEVGMGERGTMEGGFANAQGRLGDFGDGSAFTER